MNTIIVRVQKSKLSQFVGILFCTLVVLLGSGAPKVYAGPLINQRLPEYLKMDLEFRYRFEYRENFDFSDSREDDDAFHLLRTRVGLTFKPVKPLSLFIQGQDSRISNADFEVKTAYENYMDIRQLYLNYEDNVAFEPLQMNKFSMRAGRQEFSYGAQRLIGGFNWSNVAQTFDGGKIGFHFLPAHVQLDFLGGDKSPIKSPIEGDDLFDTSTKDRVYAYYLTAKALHETQFDNYLIHRQTWKNVSFGPSGSSEISDYTFGGRVKKAFANGIDYELEAAEQWGNFKDQDVRSTMAVGIVGYTLVDHKWKPRAAFEFDYGSGDSNPTDGKMTTFDNLYPTNHLFYGYIDFISLQNLNDYRYQFSFKPHKRWKLQTDLHLIYLDTPKDSWYTVGRTVARTAAAGSTDVSTHIGNEIDVVADYKVNEYIATQFGYSHFFSGKYLQQTGANDDADFIYMQTTFSF